MDIGQRGSGRVSVSSAARWPHTEPALGRRMRWDEAMGKPRPVGAYANQRLTPAAAGKTHGGQAKVPNRTREIRPSGIIGGPRETWLYAGAPELYPNQQRSAGEVSGVAGARVLLGTGARAAALGG